jgi:hypothetical protein
VRRIALIAGVALMLLTVPAAALDPGEVVLVNRAPDGSHPNASMTSKVSGDGRCVLFTSAAAAMPGANGQQQVYLRDTEAETTSLVSATPGGTGGDDQSSAWASARTAGGSRSTPRRATC